MSKAEILDKLARAVVDHNREAAISAAKEAIAMKIDPVEAINNGLAAGMKIVGDKFGRYEYPLPFVLLAADAMQAAIDILVATLPRGTAGRTSKGKIVIGTAYGDVHSIGKNLVKTMLSVSGYDVYDLGVEVPSESFIKKAEEVNADIIAVSALMTASMSYQKDVIDKLVDKGLRDKYKVMVGGSPVTPAFAESIGADAFGADMADAVTKADELVRQKSS